MDGVRVVAVAPQPPEAQDVELDAPRRHSSVFRNIRGVSVAPRVSDARGSRQRGSSLLRTVREAASIAPHPLDMSGELRPPLYSRGSNTLQSVEEDGGKAPQASLAPGVSSRKRHAFIVPIPLPPRQPSKLVKSITMFGYSLAPLYDLWEQLQVSHCGQYSVERMLALDEYCRRTSFTRVVLVCFLTPLMPLLLVMLLELVPLRPVEAGATRNYVFWLRHALSQTITILCAEMQAKSWIPELALTKKQALAIALGTTSVNTALEVLVAELWVFPVPFLAILGSPLLLLCSAIASVLVLGLNPLQGIQDGEFRGRRFVQIIAVQTSLLLIYPAYQAISLSVNGFLQMLIVSLVPVINVALKNTLVACGSHLEDNLPEMVVLTVDGFSALYSVLCMRGTNSLQMVAITVTLNVAVMVLSLHGMNRRSRAARESRAFHLMQMRQRQAQRTPSFLSSTAGGGSPELLSTLVYTTVKLLQAPGQLDPAELRQIRLLSGRQHELCDANSALLKSLAARCVYNNDRKMSAAISILQMKSRYASASIEGRVLSATHFEVAPPPQSRLAQRIRAAIRAIPATTTRKIGSGVGSGLGSFPSFRSSSRDRTSKKSDTDSGSDSFPRLPSVPRITKLVKASSRWLTGQTSSSRSLPPLPTPPPPTGLDLDASAKLRPLIMTGSPVINDVLVETRRRNTRAVKQSLQLLFNNEYLGLIAYTQCVIPTLYVLYMPILQALPNNVYYPTHFVLMDNAERFLDRIVVIAILAVLQLAVLAMLHVFVATRFAVSTVYQIAFVLETHFMLVESRLLVWFIFAVQSTLSHYGNSYPDLYDSQGCLTV
jgi:hypothetical protein